MNIKLTTDIHIAGKPKETFKWNFYSYPHVGEYIENLHKVYFIKYIHHLADTIDVIVKEVK